MATTPTPIFPQTITNAAVAIVNSDGTNKKTVYTGATNGSKIESISITSTDTTARVLNVYITVSGTDYQVGTINVPITAGTDAAATASVSMLENTVMMPWIRKDSSGRPYIYLASGSVLKVASQTTLTSNKEIDLVAQIGDY